MKIKSISLGLAKTLNLGNYESTRLDLGTVIDLDEEDSTNSVILDTKQYLTNKLHEWEAEIQLNPQPALMSAETLAAPPKIDETPRKSLPTKAKTPSETLECPLCQKPMYKKEGKEYYLCQKHWGFPAMIKQGKVRERKF